MVDDEAVSFPLSAVRGLFEAGVGISSIEVADEVVLVVSAPETTGAGGVIGMTEETFPFTRTTFFPMADRGSSFLDRIFSYMPLLNLVVISETEGDTVKKTEQLNAITRLTSPNTYSFSLRY